MFQMACAWSSCRPTRPNYNRPKPCRRWSTNPSSTARRDDRRTRRHHWPKMRRPRQRTRRDQRQSRLPLVAKNRQAEVISRKPYNTLNRPREPARPKSRQPFWRQGLCDGGACRENRLGISRRRPPDQWRAPCAGPGARRRAINTISRRAFLTLTLTGNS